MLTEAQVIKILKAEVDRVGGLTKLALEWGNVSVPYIHHVVHGLKPPGPTICKNLGLERVITTKYRRILE